MYPPTDFSQQHHGGRTITGSGLGLVYINTLITPLFDTPFRRLRASLDLLLVPETKLCPDLQRIIDAWGTLSAAVKAGILAMVGRPV